MNRILSCRYGRRLWRAETRVAETEQVRGARLFPERVMFRSGPMLKITLEPGIEEARLKLEGDLAGTWVPELEEFWRTTRASPPGRAVCLDLTGVLRVDEAGRYAKALLHESGARMVSGGVEMKALLDSIRHDWPRLHIEGPGWSATPASNRS